MAARTPTLSGAGNPFGVSNSAFGAFNQGSGQDPIFKELAAASEKRYEVGLRYNNGQAGEAEYQAAIAAEMAIAQRMLGSANPDVVSSAHRNIAELGNLSHDVKNHAAEVAANAANDDGEALIAVYERELSEMQPGSTGYVDLQRRISDMRDSISNKRQADNARQAAFELATVQNAWEAGAATDEAYKAAYAKYAAAQKPGTTEAVNAAANLRDLTYRLDRNGIVAKVDAGTSSLDDLLAFDQAHLSGMHDQSSQGYRDALGAFQGTQKAVYDRDRAKIEDDIQHNKATPEQGIAFYKQAAVAYGANHDIVLHATDRIASLNDAVQAKRDSDAINAFNDGKMKPQDFIAYATTRQASFAPGTSAYGDWGSRITAAKKAAVEPAILSSYALSQKAISLQQFIADNSAGPAHGTKTTTRQVLGADGKYRTVTTTTDTPPTPAEVAAWKQRQSEVADAKTQLTVIQGQIAATPNGFVTSQQMLAYWHQQLAGVAVGSPEYWSFTDKINSTNDRIHAEALLQQGGIKIGFPGITQTGLAAGGTAGGTTGTAPSVGGGGGGAGARPGAIAGGSSVAPPTGSFAPPKGARFGGIAGGRYSKAEIDYVANRISQLTGLDPQATRLWVIKEQGGGNNPLGVSGIGSAGHSGIRANFSTVEEGIAAAASWINTHGNMRSIKASVGKSPQEQIDAIDRSPWGPGGGRGGYNGSLISLANQYGYKTPGATGTVPSGGAPGTSIAGAPPAAKPPKEPSLSAFLNGLGHELSGGDYNSRNSKTGEFGKYQILPGQWSAWAAQYLGDANAAPTPENQERVVSAKATELHTKLGSWQAVAHWWATGGAGGDPKAEGNPSTWGTADTQFVNNVIHAAGGQVVAPAAAPTASHLPTAPGAPYATPTTVITTAAGKGVASGLQAIVPGTRSRDAKSGLTTQQTVGIDFPSNLDGDYFAQLYGHIHTALDNGDTSYVYHDASTGQSVNILLPDNPMGRAALINGLDSSRIDLAQARAVAAAGTDREATENANYTSVVKQAGANQLRLLDTEYGGRYKKGSDMFALAAGVKSAPIARGLGANPRSGPTSAELAGNKNLRDEAFSPGGMTGGLQTNSLTPVASAIRVTDYTKNYVAVETALAKKAWESGRATDAWTHLQNIELATGDHSQLIQQIAVYNAQGQVGAKAITGITGGTDDKVAADIATMKQSGQDIADSKANADKLAGEIKPFLKTTATGDVVYDVGPSGATLKLADNTVWYVDPRPDGTLKFTPTKLAAAGYGNTDDPNKPQSKDPERVPAQVPSGDRPGALTTAYAKWHLDVIGYMKTADGTLLPVQGRVLDVKSPDGQFIVADPFQDGRWAPGPIYWSMPKSANVRMEATTKADGSADGTGRAAITFDGKDGTTYKLVVDDPKVGTLNVYKLSPPDAAQRRQQSGGASANTQENHNALAGEGLGLSTGDNRRDTVGFLLTPNINGPWVTSYEAARDTIYGPRVQTFGRQLLGAITSTIDNVMGYGAGSVPGVGRVRGGSWGSLPGPTPMPSANPRPGPGLNLNPLDWAFPPAVNAAGVPASPRSIGAPPPAAPVPVAPRSTGSRGYIAAPPSTERVPPLKLPTITPLTNAALPPGTADAQTRYAPPPISKVKTGYTSAPAPSTERTPAVKPVLPKVTKPKVSQDELVRTAPIKLPAIKPTPAPLGVRSGAARPG